MVTLNKMGAAIIVVLFILTVSGCSQLPSPVKDINTAPPLPPKPTPVQLLDVDWDVFIIDGTPYYAVDTRGYTNLSINMQEIRRFLLEAKNYANTLEKYNSGTPVPKSTGTGQGNTFDK